MYVQLLEAQERVTPQWNNRQSMHRYGATDFTPGGSQIQDIRNPCECIEMSLWVISGQTIPAKIRLCPLLSKSGQTLVRSALSAMCQ